MEVKSTKKIGAQIWAKGAEIGLETKFFFHFLKFGSLVFLQMAYNDILQQSIASIRGKNYEKDF